MNEVILKASDVRPVLKGMRLALDWQRSELLRQFPDLDDAYDYADFVSGGLHILDSMCKGTHIAEYWQDYGMEEYGDEKRLHYKRRAREDINYPLPSEPSDSENDDAYRLESGGCSSDEVLQLIAKVQSL